MTGDMQVEFVSAERRHQHARGMRYPERIKTPTGALLFHPIEGFLEQCEVGRLAELFARRGRGGSEPDWHRRQC